MTLFVYMMNLRLTSSVGFEVELSGEELGGDMSWPIICMTDFGVR